MIRTAELGSGWLATALILAGLAACSKAPDPSIAQTAAPASAAADSEPAAGNLAPSDQTAVSQLRVVQDGPPDYANLAPAPGDMTAPAEDSNSAYDLQADAQSYPPGSGYDASSYDEPTTTYETPPLLPEYTQPEIPGRNYCWIPGYWAHAPRGYFWVPGDWVLAPWINALWTPPYWDYERGLYRFHAGYWGTHVGFYGGIHYGFGYPGRGYYGAYWNHGTLNYNLAVSNVHSPSVPVYSYPLPSRGYSRTSFNGGIGGVSARPTQQEIAVVHDPRTPPLAVQVQRLRDAAADQEQFISAGHAQPVSLADARPLSTGYRFPAEQPPAAALHVIERPVPAQARQAEPQRLMPGTPVATTQSQPETPIEQPAPATHPIPEIRQTPAPMLAQRPAPENRPAQPAAAQRPFPELRASDAAPEVHAAPQPAIAPRPAPEPSTAAPPVSQRAIEARPAPQPERRPVPEIRLASPVAQPEPRQEVRPALQPAVQLTPQPEARPAPQSAPRPAPEVRAPSPPPPPAPARTEIPARTDDRDKDKK